MSSFLTFNNKNTHCRYNSVQNDCLSNFITINMKNQNKTKKIRLTRESTVQRMQTLHNIYKGMGQDIHTQTNRARSHRQGVNLTQ